MFTLVILAIVATLKIYAIGLSIIAIILFRIVRHWAKKNGVNLDKYIQDDKVTTKGKNIPLKTDLEDDIFNNVKGYYILTLSGNNFIPVARFDTESLAQAKLTELKASGKTAVLKTVA